jgi:hypothetical protein
MGNGDVIRVACGCSDRCGRFALKEVNQPAALGSDGTLSGASSQKMMLKGIHEV